jgi:hypothetical protein
MLARLGYWRELEIRPLNRQPDVSIRQVGLSGHCRNYRVEVNVFTSRLEWASAAAEPPQYRGDPAKQAPAHADCSVIS